MSNSTQKICPKCKGKKWYQYDDVHSKFCEVCCKHDQGYWLLPEGYTSAGNYCCNAGCGHTITPKEYKKMSNSTQNDWEKKWAKLEKFIYYASAKDFPMDSRKRVCIDAVQAKIMVEELLADARREVDKENIRHYSEGKKTGRIKAMQKVDQLLLSIKDKPLFATIYEPRAYIQALDDVLATLREEEKDKYWFITGKGLDEDDMKPED